MDREEPQTLRADAGMPAARRGQRSRTGALDAVASVPADALIRSPPALVLFRGSCCR